MTNENFESECNAQVALLCHNPPYRFYRLFTPSTLLSFSSISQLRSHPSLPSLPTPPLTPKSIKKYPSAEGYYFIDSHYLFLAAMTASIYALILGAGSSHPSGLITLPSLGL